LFREASLLPFGEDASSALARARARQFAEVYISKINPFYYAAVIRGEHNVGPGLVEAIEKYIVPLLPGTTFVVGEKFGLAEILVSPFVLRLYLVAKLGFLGEGVEGKLDKIEKWNKWATAVLANESLKKTFNLEYEGRKAIDRIRKVREVNNFTAQAATNGTK
jgi:glutathione S-transferase